MFAVLLTYTALSVFFFGVPIVNHMSSRYLGELGDPSIYMWGLVWWPHALQQHLNPFFTDTIWAPTGINLTWTTTIPGASLLAYPITASFGPIVSYNIWCLLAPALAAWTAFILCRHLVSSFWPSLLGGYVFGFSPYVLAQMRGHLFLVLIFPVPIVVYLTLRRFQNSLQHWRFVFLLALTLSLQFCFSTEIFATMTIFGAAAIIIARFTLPADRVGSLYSTAWSIVLGYALTALILSPFIYSLFAYGYPHGPLSFSEEYSADLVNFLVPTPMNYLGGSSLLIRISQRFRGNLSEIGSYVGIILGSITCLYAVSNWKKGTTKLLIVSLLVICVAALGEVVHIAGISTIPGPWAPFARLPFLEHALPVRFMVYAFLVLAMICALYFANSTEHNTRRNISALLVAR